MFFSHCFTSEILFSIEFRVLFSCIVYRFQCFDFIVYFIKEEEAEEVLSDEEYEEQREEVINNNIY